MRPNPGRERPIDPTRPSGVPSIMPMSTPSSTLSVPARRWVFPESPDAATVSRLSGELGLSVAFSRLLVRRGYVDPAAAKRFLRPQIDQIHPPRLLAGMDGA